MLTKPIKKKKEKEVVASIKKPIPASSKVLNRQLSHVVLTEPKIKHKRQSSYAPTNNQSTSQKVSIGLEATNRKPLQSASKKINVKSKKNIKSPRIKKFESYLLYIDTQFTLFSENTKSKLSDYSTEVKKQIDIIEEKDDIIELIKKYKRDYVISQSKQSQYQKQKLTPQDKAADNIKNKWKLYRTRKLINKFIRINKIKQRPENIPSNINKIDKNEGKKHLQPMLSVQTIKSEYEIGYMDNLLIQKSSAQQIPTKTKVIIVRDIPCIQNIRIKQIQSIMLKQKQSITLKHNMEIQELDRKYRNKQISRFEYQKAVKNANTFVGLRYTEINQSILNARKLVSQTDGLLHELESQNIKNRSPLRCQSEKRIMTYSEQTAHKDIQKQINYLQSSLDKDKDESIDDKSQQSPNKRQKIVEEMLNDIIFEFCKDTQKYPYIQKIMVQSFADWKIGVECNQDSIDLFCQNIIQYALSSDTSPFQNLKVPLGCSPDQLLKLHHSMDYEPDKQEDVIADKVFKDFSKLMVFPLKSKNSPKQLSIIKLIQVLNHYHNRAIFESLNQALDYQRVYGIVGKPLPWKPQPNFKKLHVYQSLSLAVDRVMNFQEWRLGFHPQNFFKIRPDLTMRNLNMFRDQKLNRLMQFQQKQLQVYWQNDQMQETFMLLDLSNLVCNYILAEISKELNSIIKRRSINKL